MKAILILLLSALIIFAGDKKEAKPEVKAELSEKEYQEIVKNLASDSPSLRKDTRQKLKDLNSADLKALIKILKSSKDPELTELAKELLGKEQKNGVWVSTKSGLKYKIVKKGKGKKLGPASTVKVHYEGKFNNGKVFDSSFARGNPASFPLNGVIKGWTEGLQLMPEGSVFIFKIPPELAYGQKDTGPIPANSTLIFKVQLISVQ